MFVNHEAIRAVFKPPKRDFLAGSLRKEDSSGLVRRTNSLIASGVVTMQVFSGRFVPRSAPLLGVLPAVRHEGVHLPLANGVKGWIA